MSEPTPPIAVTEEDVNEQIKVRQEKLKAIKEKRNAYPNDFKRAHFAQDLHHEFDEVDKQVLEEKGHEVSIAGRMMTRRLMGKASFITLQDMSGPLQVYLRKNDLPEGRYDDFKHWDIGDIVGVKGKLFKTKTGELSVYANSIALLTKSLRPLPDKFHGLSDKELCYRQRYLDLLMNERSRQVFKIRSALIQGIREFLVQRRFVEVETPMMQAIPGGAAARPFKTHHNALDMPLYLRIAPELYLKRLVVGSIERVFEINRNFRNEGLSTRHNPEFTMLEFYQAYADYKDLMDLTEEMMRYLAQKTLGKLTLTYQDHTIDFEKPFERLTVIEAILKFNPTFTLEQLENRDRACQLATDLGIPIKESYGIGKIQIEIFEKTVENQLMDPTFITEYPTEVSPLARRNDDNPMVTDRFEFFVTGRELANGFSELNDPQDQSERFKEQVAALESGDQEAMHFDGDYIRALEYGLAPTAGEGIGIDRLAMLFTNSASIRDVILFPHMRPSGK